LIKGGRHAEYNLVPVLVEPHKVQTKLDKAFKKTVNKKRLKNLDITRPKQTIGQRRVLREVVAKAAGGKGQTVHEAAMAAKNKRVVPRRII
jgi:hypothetical protein